MGLLQDTHVWFLISFLVFAGIAWKMGRVAVLNALDSRIESIRREIQNAEGLRIEAQELLAQYQRKHRDAMKEAEKIIESAQKSADANLIQVEENLKETLDRREQQLQERIKRIQQSAMQEIQNYAADLAMKAATEIIANKLDKKADSKLVDQSIKDLSAQIQ